jgi:hypothetical protein
VTSEPSDSIANHSHRLNGNVIMINDPSEGAAEGQPLSLFMTKSNHLQMCNSSSDNYTSNPALMEGYLEPNVHSVESKSDMNTALSQRGQQESWRRRGLEQANCWSKDVHAYLNNISNQEVEEQEAYQIQNVDDHSKLEQQTDLVQTNQYLHSDAPL